jgi:hypothetical protein
VLIGRESRRIAFHCKHGSSFIAQKFNLPLWADDVPWSLQTLHASDFDCLLELLDAGKRAGNPVNIQGLKEAQRIVVVAMIPANTNFHFRPLTVDIANGKRK